MAFTIGIIVAYFLVVAFLGYLGFRHTHDTKDYLIGGRKINPIIMALSYGSTFISTSAIIGFGSAAAVHGMGLLWLTFLNIFVGIFVAFVIFGKRTRKIGHNLNSHTFPELLGSRFKSTFIQKYSGVIVFAFMPLYAAAVMIGAAKLFSTALSIDYNIALLFFAVITALYVSMGGIKGVMYTDAFQAGIMFFGMVILIIFTYNMLGGITPAHQKLTQLFAELKGSEGLAGMEKGGFLGWTAMPAFGGTNWWKLVSSIVMGVGIGVLAQPQLVVRFMTVKSNRELNRAVPAGGIFILMMTGVAFVVGALSNRIFFDDIGKTALAATIGADGKAVADNIIPLFIKEYMPQWFSAVFLVCMLSAGMSTLSAQMHAMGTAISRDIFKPKEKTATWFPKVGVLISIFITTLLAYYLPAIFKAEGMLIIATGTALFFGLCAATFLPMYVGTLFFKKMPKVAAVSGMLAGSLSSIFWMLFVHEAESKSLLICKTLFGVDTLAPVGTMWKMVDPIFIALPISILVTVLVSIFAKKETDMVHINKAFDGI